MNHQRIEKITNYIFLKSEIGKANLAIIFGTRHKEVVQKAAKMYKKRLVEAILITGGRNRITGQNEACKIRKELKKKGVKTEDIFLEDKATNTLENVLFSKELIERKIGFENVEKIMVITKHYHMRRALMTLQKHFPSSIKFLPVNYQVLGFSRNDWFKSKRGREKVLGEMEKIKKYLKKGDIEKLSQDDQDSKDTHDTC